MNILMLPAVLGLILKLYILATARNFAGPTTVFQTLLFLLAAHNAIEILVFITSFSSNISTLVVKGYYAINTLLCGYFLLYVMEITNKATFSKSKIWVYIAGFAILFTVVASERIIVGATLSSHVSTAIRGDLYWMFQTWTLLISCSVVSLLIYRYRHTSDQRLKNRCLYTLIAVLPVVVTGVSIICLMAIGINISASTIVPISTTLFLIIVIASEKQHKITDIRQHIPFTQERKTSQQVQQVMSNYFLHKTDIFTARDKLEKLLLEHRLTKTECNISKTAETIGADRGTVYKWLKKHDIKLNR